MFRSFMDRNCNRYDSLVGRIFILFDIDRTEQVEPNDSGARCCQLARVKRLSGLVGQLLLDKLRGDLCDARDLGVAENAVTTRLDVISYVRLEWPDLDHCMALYLSVGVRM